MIFDGFELREFLLHIVGSVDEKTGVGFEQHSRVVIGIAGGDDVVVQLFQRRDSFSFLVWDTQFIIQDAIVFDDEFVAKERGPV